MDNNKELRGQVAHLESTVDVLETEISSLNEMLLRCGFPEGIHTLRVTVEGILAEEDREAQ